MLLASLLALYPDGPLEPVLMVGNSHTHSHRLAETLSWLAASDDIPAGLVIETAFAPLLNDAAQSPTIRSKIQSGRFRYVILQGAALSSSHKHKHPQNGAVELVELAKSAEAKPLLFAEWPRKGWDETSYIANIYQEIAAQSSAPIIQTGPVWDSLAKKLPSLQLWEIDGNHATAQGAFAAAFTLYRHLYPHGKPYDRPNAVTKELEQTVKDLLPPKPKEKKAGQS